MSMHDNSPDHVELGDLDSSWAPPEPDSTNNGSPSAARGPSEEEEKAHLEFKRACKQRLPMIRDSSDYSEMSRGDPWLRTNMLVDKHDNDLCKDWANDVDTLLTFTGLFAATVTAFVIESYQWLQPDSVELTVIFLARISEQLANPGNTTALSIPNDFSPAPSVKRINIFWILSLTMSLMTALIGILCKQWLREYQKDASLPFSDMLSVRQMRLEGFKFWRVEDILSYLPLLLQIALLLFFIGLLDLIWHLERQVALVVTVVVACGYAILIGTTLLPSVVYLARLSIRTIPPCSFKSPQSWLFIRIAAFFERVVSEVIRVAKCSPPTLNDGVRVSRLETWLHLERQQLGAAEDMNDIYLSRAIQWVDEHYAQNVRVVDDVAACVQVMAPFHLGWLFDPAHAEDLEWFPSPIVRDVTHFTYLANHQSKLGSEKLVGWATLLLGLQNDLLPMAIENRSVTTYIQKYLAPTFLRTYPYVERTFIHYLEQIKTEPEPVLAYCECTSFFLRCGMGALVYATREAGIENISLNPMEFLKNWGPMHLQAATGISTANAFIRALDMSIVLALRPPLASANVRRWNKNTYPPHIILHYLLTEIMSVIRLSSDSSASRPPEFTVVDWPQLTYPDLVDLKRKGQVCHADDVWSLLTSIILRLEDARRKLEVQPPPGWNALLTILSLNEDRTRPWNGRLEY